MAAGLHVGVWQGRHTRNAPSPVNSAPRRQASQQGCSHSHSEWQLGV